MSNSVLYDYQRWVGAAPADVRRALLDVLRRDTFRITIEQVSVLEAERGSHVATLAMQFSKLPISVTIQVQPADGGTGLSFRLADKWKAPLGSAWGLNSSYTRLFDEVRAKLDAALARLDPDAAGAFEPARCWAAHGDVGVVDRANVRTAGVAEAAVTKANTVLEGGDPNRMPARWRHVQGTRFDAPDASLQLDLEMTRACLTVAALVADDRGPLPPALSQQVEALAARLEGALGSGTTAVLAVAEEEKPVVQFLVQQARIRGLPTRVLTVCGDCKFQKVTNPDYQRMLTRNQRLRSLTSGIGGTIGRHGISPFIVFGTMFKLQHLDADFVCPRCQGMHGASHVVTFCPDCGDRRDDSVLTTCRKCKHDFRKAVPKPTWTPLAAAPAPTALAVGAAPPPPAPPRPPVVCSICGSSGPRLWEVVVATPGGPHPRIVCGTPPRCRPRSLQPPRQV